MRLIFAYTWRIALAYAIAGSAGILAYFLICIILVTPSLFMEKTT